MTEPRRVPARRAIALFLMAIGVSACSMASAADTVTGTQAHELVSAGATLVDVRSDGEWQSGHLEGAVHIPVNEIAARMSELPQGHPVVVYCASGMRSAQAAGVLRSAGYEVRDLGAMSNWN